MGNYVSCTLSAGKNSKSAKVIFPTGEIRQYKQATKAAELMFEMPNNFIANAKSLQIGRRFSPLNADEDLEMSNVYVMFNMRRLNSTVTATDMGGLLITAKSAAKRASFGSIRILPECSDHAIEIVQPEPKKEENVMKLNLDDIEEYSIIPELQQRRSFCRSKKPLLETIVEEPVC